MKIQMTREQLLNPLQKVSNVVERRQTLPILANVLIESDTNHLSITATDLEVEMKTEASCQTEGGTSFTLPARKLLDICKALPDGADVQLTMEGERAIIRSGRGRYSLGVLPAQDYPAIEAVKGEHCLEVEQQALKRLLEKTAFAMAQQDVRYYLNGLLLEADKGLIRTVATDGHRLSLAETEVDIPSDLSVRIILPRKAVIELGRLLTDSKDKVSIDVSANHVRFHLSDTTFTSKLIDGRFPDYDKVIPAKGRIKLKAQTGALRHSLSRASILSNEKYRGIRFQLEKDLLRLVANNPEQEEAEEEIEVDYSGEALSVGFNVSYLLDVLNVIETEEVVFSLSDPNSSCLIQSDPPDACRFVVMPMRL